MSEKIEYKEENKNRLPQGIGRDIFKYLIIPILIGYYLPQIVKFLYNVWLLMSK